MGTLVRRMPDRRGAGLLLGCHGYVRRHFGTKEPGVVYSPAWRRDLDDAYKVKGWLCSVELRILPDNLECRSTNGVGVAGIGYVTRSP